MVEDFDLVRNYVVEQTRIASMEQMGVDQPLEVHHGINHQITMER